VVCGHHLYPDEARLDVPVRHHGLVFPLFIDWQIDQSLEIGFMLETMKRALVRRKPTIINNDQGSHFTSPQYINLLKENEVRISMDGKGRAKDNIDIERFWRSLKYNEVYIKDYNTPRETRTGVEGYIHLRNHYLPHQPLQNQTPADVYNRDVVLLSTCE
jgi:putative transposase